MANKPGGNRYWNITTVAGEMRLPAVFHFPFVRIKWPNGNYTLNHAPTNECISGSCSPRLLNDLEYFLLKAIPAHSSDWHDWPKVEPVVRFLAREWENEMGVRVKI